VTREGDSEDYSDVEVMEFFTKTFKYLTKNKKRFPGKSSGSKGSGYKDKKDDQKGCFNCKKHAHFISDCLEL